MTIARFSFLITSKSVNDDQRIIRGIATSPRPDRLGDVVVMDGVESASDIPFMLHHDSRLPVGRAKLGKPTKAGIPFEARLPTVAEQGTLRDRVDEAWHSVKYGVITAVSIGFRVLDDAIEAIQGTNGLKFLKTEVMELSLVAVPAQPQAVITGFKSLEQKAIDSIYASIQAARPAATGNKGMPSQSTGPSGSPDASGNSRESRPKGTAMKTLQELREERQTKSDRIAELMAARKNADGSERRFNADEAKEFDDLTEEIGQLDDDIRVKAYHETNARTAVPVRAKSVEEGTASRGGISFVRKTDPDDKFKGQSFTRCLIAKAMGMMHGESPIAVANDRWGKTHPNLVNFIKATVAGGGTGSGEWGSELAQLDGKFTGDFIEYLYSKTVFDQLALRQIPARVRVKGQDGAFTGYWVGESKAIPASKGDYSAVDLDPLKVAALAVISMELLEDSSPAAEVLVRDGLEEASTQRIDTTFLSSAAAVSGVSPAGILNSVSAITPSGTDLAAVRADLQTLLYPFVTNKMASGITLVMNPATAMALGMMYGSLDQVAFPDINETGGKLGNRPVVVGDNVTPGDIIAIRTQDVWRIGDSGIRVSMSRDATIEQRDDPSGATDTPVGVNTTGLTSMFQEESVAFKVVRRINFQKRRSTAVTRISDAEYGGVVS